MTKMTELLQSIGWSKELIEHFMISDDVDGSDDFDISEVYVSESTTSTLKYDTLNAKSNIVLTLK